MRMSIIDNVPINFIGWYMLHSDKEIYVQSAPNDEGTALIYVDGIFPRRGYGSLIKHEPKIRSRLFGKEFDKAVDVGTLLPPSGGRWIYKEEE